MALFAYFSVGLPEILLGLLCLGVLGAIVVIAIVLATKQKGGSRVAANPNLFPCPDCGRMVSRQAPACPQCGRPLLPPGES